MKYTTLFDLQANPPVDWRTMVIPVGLSIAAALAGYFTRPGNGRKGLFVFAILFLVLPLGLQGFYYYYLKAKKAQVVEGVLANCWKKDWTTRRDGKNEHHSQEGFRVNEVKFWYNRPAATPSFTNSGPVRYQLNDGLAVRIHYVPVEQLDTDVITNEIVKVEVVAR